MSLLPSKPDASPSEDAQPRVVGVDSEDAEEVLSALSSETARKLLSEVHDDPAPPSDLADRVDTSLQNAQYHLENLEDAGAVEVVDTAYSAKGREMDVYAAADQPLVIFAGDKEEGSVLRTALKRLVGALGLLALASLAVQALVGRLSLVGGDQLSAPTADSGGADGGGDGVAATDTATATATPGADGGDGGGDVGIAGVEETPTPEAAGTPTATASPTPQPQATGTPVPTGTPTEIRTPAPTGTPETYEEIAGTSTPVETVGAAADVGRDAAAGLPPGLLFFAGGAFVLAVVTVLWYVRQ